VREVICAIHQPQYLPWLGYFDKIDRADVFVLLDTVQYKKNEWQNRNRIKTATGAQWLTVPVCYHYPELIKDVTINNRERWAHKHQQALRTNYAKAPYWEYLTSFWHQLWEVNVGKTLPFKYHRCTRALRVAGHHNSPHRGISIGSPPRRT